MRRSLVHDQAGWYELRLLSRYPTYELLHVIAPSEPETVSAVNK